MSSNCNFMFIRLPIVTTPSSISVTKTATLNGAGDVGDTIDYDFVVTNTGTQNLSYILINDPVAGTITGTPIPNLSSGMSYSTLSATYTIKQSDVDNGFVTNVVTVTAADENFQTVQDTDTTTTILGANLFFTMDGSNPIAWTGTDYVDQCFRVDSDNSLIRGIAEATTYINANYPGQTLDNSDGTWDGPATGPIMVHDATLLITNETTVGSTLVRLPIVNGVTDVFIDWGDGSPLEVSPGLTSNASHTYTLAGTYQASVCGELTKISWTVASTAQRQFLRSIDQWGDTGATEASFSQSDGITAIDGNLSSTITDLSQFLFSADSNPDLTNFDVSNVTDFSQMFFLSNGVTPNTALWDTSSALTMSNMFALSDANPDVTLWDVSNVTNFNSMFENADNAVPNTALWNTSSATDMADMFLNCALANPDVTLWDVSNVTTFSNIFNGAPSATPDVSLWNTSSAINMQGMFFGATSATPDVTNWDVSNVTNMSNLFYNAFLAAPDVSLWNVSNVTNMSNMFRGTNLANPDVSGFNMLGVTNISGMFSDADAANPDVSGWNTSTITNMSNAFALTAIANPDVSGWDTSSVTNMSSMFLSALSATPDVSLWNTSNVTNMLSMFNGGIANPNVTNWDVSSVTNMASMFNGNTVANPNVSSWITTSITNLSSMFSGATAANPNVSGFDTSNVTTFNSMFNAATSANPDVSTWDFQSINSTFSSMSNIFNNSGISVANYDNALIQIDAQATLHSKNGYNMGTINQNYTIATSGAARANLVGPLGWSITDNGGI